MKRSLVGKTPEELSRIAVQAGLPPFAGKQIARWLYVNRVSEISQMTNLSKAGREALEKEWEPGWVHPIAKSKSADGTVKYLFPVGGDSSNAVEAVMIPDGERKTLCVSSQAGCKMGCRFCMTGRQGFHGNLDAAAILSQFFTIEEADELTNCVFMGMGEPLDNWEQVKRVLEILTAPWGLGWSPKRITLSTIGVLPRLKEFLDSSRCHLAVSLHNIFPQERAEMMPAQKAWSISEIIRLIKQYDFSGQRRVSFEYTVFEGWNDDFAHADALAQALRGLECRVNLIRFHRIPDFPYESCPPAKMEAFRARLESHGVTATIRASRGEDIDAACGLLAGKHRSESQL